MKHKLELTTIELMIAKISLDKMKFENLVNERIRAEIIEKILDVVREDLGQGGKQ